MPSLTETRAHLHSEATRSPLVCGYQQLRVCVVSIWRCTPVPIREFIASLWMCAPLAESASLLHIWVYNIIMKLTWYITLQNLKKLPISVQFWTKALNRAPCYSWDTWMCMEKSKSPAMIAMISHHCCVNLKPTNITMKVLVVLKFSLYLACLWLTLERFIQCLLKFKDNPVGININFDSFINEEVPR